MIGAVLFVIVFLGFLSLTLGVPTFPPGIMIFDMLGIPQTDFLVLGIPAWQLINAIVNGVIYGFIIWLIYSLTSKVMSRGKESTQTIQQTVSVLIPATEQAVDSRKDKVVGSISLLKIGPTYATRLMEAGINTIDNLLKMGSTRRGREKLAAKTGISGTLILEWVNLADLFRIKGIGREYSDLLEEAGVDTVIELARRNPENLHETMHEVNEQKVLVKRPPTLNEVTKWIEQAKNLPRKVKY